MAETMQLKSVDGSWDDLPNKYMVLSSSPRFGAPCVSRKLVEHA